MSKFEEKETFISSPEFQEAYKKAMADTGDWRPYFSIEKPEIDMCDCDDYCKKKDPHSNPSGECHYQGNLIADAVRSCVSSDLIRDMIDSLKQIDQRDCTEEVFETIQAAIEDLEKCL